MKFFAGSLAIAVLAISRFAGAAQEEPRLLAKVTPLPVALNKDFEFRKTKLYFLSERQLRGQGKPAAASVKQSAANEAYSKSATSQDVSITFERDYRLFGAVTGLDRRQRFGNYFDFFWRAKRPADVTVRLEYRQEKLHAQVQAQEVSYGNVRGTQKTEFKVIGDDYFDDGKVIAWRCLLIENGAVVAENRSFLWE
ncbi:MAG: hypothetical protein ACREIW_15160 [Chthoniobacterales bacterium]